jgi:hypothetical protein
LRENGWNFVGDREPFGIVLPLSFADEIVNPEIAVLFQRTPYLFRDPFEKKDAMETGLSYDQIECLFR